MVSVSTAEPRNVKRTLAALVFIALSLTLPARAEWEYVRADKTQGTITVSTRRGSKFVSARQFCFAFGCRAFYQWGSHRAVIQNPEAKSGAILSALTRVALVDGVVLDFDGEVISDPREGYLLPLDLARKLATSLKLGKILEHEPEQTLKPANNLAFSLRTIVIDPGHGGSDFGTGFGGIHEKDVAVIYALKLRDELKEALPGAKVLLTRDNDRYVSLPDRAKFANVSNADLFVSLHLNHAADGKAEGVETYILSTEATDDEAKKVALLENDTWLKNARIGEAGDNIRKILIDMEQTKYIQTSALVASMVHQEFSPLDKRHGLKSRGVKQAMFYVLSQVSMPSTLIEMGFLSNTGDRSRLMDVVFRDEFVKSIVSALKRYRDRLTGGK